MPRKRSNKQSRSKTRVKPTKQHSAQKTWEEFLKQEESRKILKQSWKAKNPQKDFSHKIRQLHKKFSSKKRR